MSDILQVVIDLEKLAKKIIEENVYATLGTSDRDNLPWVSPLFVCYDDNLNFYWISPKKSKHSKNIEQNSNTSLVIFDSHSLKWEGVGVYMTGKTSEFSDKDDIVKALELEFSRLDEKVPKFENFLGNHPYRVYKFVPRDISITNDSKDEAGNSIDHRTPLSKDSLT